MFYKILKRTVKVTAKARHITIKGPRGEIKKDLSHLPIDIKVMKVATGKAAGSSVVRIQMWNGAYRQACAVYTFKSIISNCIIGVTEVSIKSICSQSHTQTCLKCFWCVFSKTRLYYIFFINYNLQSIIS